MEKQRFELKEEHIKLLSNSYTSWFDCDFGAVCIDPKRPYGNSYVYGDMIKILGITIEDDYEPSTELKEKLNKLHKETKTALEVCLAAKSFKLGIYEARKYDNDWRYVESA